MLYYNTQSSYIVPILFRIIKIVSLDLKMELNKRSKIPSARLIHMPCKHWKTKIYQVHTCFNPQRNHHHHHHQGTQIKQHNWLLYTVHMFRTVARWNADNSCRWVRRSLSKQYQCSSPHTKQRSTRWPRLCSIIWFAFPSDENPFVDWNM